MSARDFLGSMGSAVRVLGINRRNLQYIQGKNPRQNYANADDKVRAKSLLSDHSIPVPRTLAVIRARHEVGKALESLPSGQGFAIKPSRGFGGTGILIARAGAEGLVEWHKEIYRRFTKPDTNEFVFLRWLRAKLMRRKLDATKKWDACYRTFDQRGLDPVEAASWSRAARPAARREPIASLRPRVVPLHRSAVFRRWTEGS